MSRLPVAVAGAALVVLAGCTSGPGTPPSPSSAATPASAAPSSAASTPAACPDGRYRITALESRGTGSSLGTGQGGDVDFTFTDGTFLIASDGSDPVKVDVGPAKADLRIAGEIRGNYDGPADALHLVVTGASGDVTVKGLGINRHFSARNLADQLIGADARGVASCTSDGARLELPRVVLVLARR